MPLKKLTLKPGVNRENTRYTTEGGYYECDKIRFRQGTPEKIGGWVRLTTESFLGVCRSLWNWISLTGLNLVGVGTNLKFYIERGEVYFDITPLRTRDYSVTLVDPFTTVLGSDLVLVSDTAHGAQVGDLVRFSGSTAVGGIPAAELNIQHIVKTPITANDYTIEVVTPATSVATGGGTVVASYILDAFLLGANPFSTTSGSPLVTVTDAAGGYKTNDFVTFSGATTVAGLTLNGEYQISGATATSYIITASANANATTTGGGSSVYASYQINTGPEIAVPLFGWGAGPWGLGTWGVGTTSSEALRLWSQTNYGEDLIFGPRGGGIYYWDTLTGVGERAVNLGSFSDASNVPVVQNYVLVSDISRFVFAFGTNDIGSTAQDPLLVRWSDQENASNWTPAATNQAGSIRLSQGSQIISVIQSRQEILVWTDTSVYSIQYLGPPFIWGAQLVGSNISIASPNAVAYANGVAFWMGVDKFYMYNGQVQAMRCDLKRHVFEDINTFQLEQVFAGTNEGFNEVWWFYCKEDVNAVGSYVIYNYAEDVWYYGNMSRTAWLDSSLQRGPLAATYNKKLVVHEQGVDDEETDTPVAIPAYITSSQFDLDDGHQFVFINRVLPDITFRGSSAASPSVVMSLLPLQNSGSGYNDPASVGGVNAVAVTRTAIVPVEEFTEQIFTRVRGRQLSFKVESSGVGVTWQLGSPRLDMRPDGRR